MDSNLESIFNDLFKDDYEGTSVIEHIEKPEVIDVESEIKNLFVDDNSKEAVIVDRGEEYGLVDFTKQYESNSRFELDGRIYETDDNGYIYKIDNYELVIDCKYTIGDLVYITDNQGRIISCDGYPKLTPDGERDQKAQMIAGGEDRHEGDQGGHILARVLGGAKGIENMVAMRGPINQGPYSHIMEKEIGDALKEGKEVHMHVDIEYDGDSKRPSKIKVIYTIDSKETIMEYANDEGSIDLAESVRDLVYEEQYNDLKQEIQDANGDGAMISIIAVKKEYDEEDNATKIIVIMRDDNSEHPVNEFRVLSPKEVE